MIPLYAAQRTKFSNVLVLPQTSYLHNLGTARYQATPTRSETSVFEATDIPIAPLTTAPHPKTRVEFASLPRELRDKVYEGMVTVHKIIGKQCDRDVGCPEEWKTMRAMFRASPVSESFATEACETFFRINTFQMEGKSPGFLTRKTYYVRGHG